MTTATLESLRATAAAAAAAHEESTQKLDQRRQQVVEIEMQQERLRSERDRLLELLQDDLANQTAHGDLDALDLSLTRHARAFEAANAAVQNASALESAARQKSETAKQEVARSERIQLVQELRDRAETATRSIREDLLAVALALGEIGQICDQLFALGVDPSEVTALLDWPSGPSFRLLQDERFEKLRGFGQSWVAQVPALRRRA